MLLLREDLLPELELRLPALALGLLLRLELEPLRLLLLLPLDAVPRLLLPLRDEVPDFEDEEEEELRDAIACSLGRLTGADASCDYAPAFRSI